MRDIPYGRQSIDDEDIESVCSVLRSDWLTQGPKVREFEEALCEKCGAKYCILVANGTMALQLACLAIDICHGKTGLTSPISFMASANCIAYCGGRPDFVDIDPETLCISPEKVEEYCNIGQVPDVVIPVDFAGIPADLPRLKDLSESHGFKIIEDAAHAIGSTYEYGKKEFACGSCAHTDMAVFSFHPVKTITTGEGGAILTNNVRLAEKLRLLANHGIERDPLKFSNPKSKMPNPKSPPAWYHEMHVLGFNSRITDIQCALGISQLKRIDMFKARRQEIVRRYNQAFSDLVKKQVVMFPPWPEGTDPCFHLYTLRLGSNCNIGRDDLFNKLREKGIYSQVHYIPIYRQPFYQDSYFLKIERFPEAEKYFASCLSLPLFPDIDDETFDYIVRSVRNLLE
jgi:UDP-4-amino-4,6-dideoxy-N-acetyl-beta-L-altrosamine transaminase